VAIEQFLEHLNHIASAHRNIDIGIAHDIADGFAPAGEIFAYRLSNISGPAVTSYVDTAALQVSEQCDGVLVCATLIVDHDFRDASKRVHGADTAPQPIGAIA